MWGIAEHLRVPGARDRRRPNELPVSVFKLKIEAPKPELAPERACGLESVGVGVGYSPASNVDFELVALTLV